MQHQQPLSYIESYTQPLYEIKELLNFNIQESETSKPSKPQIINPIMTQTNQTKLNGNQTKPDHLNHETLKVYAISLLISTCIITQRKGSTHPIVTTEN